MNNSFSFVPGPKNLVQTVDSQNVQNIEQYSPKELFEFLLNLPDLVTSVLTDSVFMWSAVFKISQTDIRLMFTTLDGTEEGKWGGSQIEFSGSVDNIIPLWTDILKRFPATYVFNSENGLIYPIDEFKREFTGKQLTY